MSFTLRLLENLIPCLNRPERGEAYKHTHREVSVSELAVATLSKVSLPRLSQMNLSTHCPFLPRSQLVYVLKP